MSFVSSYVLLAYPDDSFPAPWWRAPDEQRPGPKGLEGTVWLRADNYGPRPEVVAAEVAAVPREDDRTLVLLYTSGDRGIETWRLVALPQGQLSEASHACNCACAPCFHCSRRDRLGERMEKCARGEHVFEGGVCACGEEESS